MRQNTSQVSALCPNLRSPWARLVWLVCVVLWAALVSVLVLNG